MNYINPNAPAAGLTRLLNMRDNNPSTQLAYVPTKDIAAMGSMGGLEFNPYSGIPQARGIAAVADGAARAELSAPPSEHLIEFVPGIQVLAARALRWALAYKRVHLRRRDAALRNATGTRAQSRRRHVRRRHRSSTDRCGRIVAASVRLVVGAVVSIRLHCEVIDTAKVTWLVRDQRARY